MNKAQIYSSIEYYKPKSFWVEVIKGIIVLAAVFGLMVLGLAI